MGTCSMKKCIAAALAACALLSAPAHAGIVIEEVKGWSVIKEDDGCSIQMEYEGPGSTKLTFGKLEEHGIGVMVMNYNWSAKDGERYETHFALDDVVYSGIAVGTSDSIWKGFIILMEDEFEQHLSRGATLHVFLGEERIDQLSLDGSSAAISAMNRCYSGVMREHAAERAEKRRWEHLPQDPFDK